MIEVETTESPASLAFDTEANDVAAPVAVNKVDVLNACSDALNEFLLTVDYATQAGIDAINVSIETEDLPLKVACEPLGDPEALGLTEDELVNHMFNALPPEALGALVQLSDSLLG